MAEEPCGEGSLLFRESASIFDKIAVKLLRIIDYNGAQHISDEISETFEDSLYEEEESKLKSRKESDYASPAQLQKDLAEESRRSAADAEYSKLRTLLRFEEAPEYLQHNPYIRGGYRKFLPTKLCWESIFWWTNETVNIWTHLFGWFLFLGLTINDLILINIHATLTDKFIAAILLGCFQVCMVSSSLYHTFSCRSENDFNCFLMYDLFGIALSLLAIYTSGIYYAFWCLPELKSFYLISVTLIFGFAMAVQLPQLRVPYAWKTLIFISWAAYGIVPTMHWVIEMGGFDNPLVAMLFPRVIGMYAISGIAFAIYFCKIPERWFAGKVDYLGHSHQWWHLFVVLALWYWHNTGMLYVQYRMNHGCAKTMRIF